MSPLVIASNNPGKLREFAAWFAPIGFETVGQGALGIDDADEPHATFVENALTKARHAAVASGMPAMADDSGLCVDVLGGEPGVRSARYAGTDTTLSRGEQDDRNNRKLIAALGDAPRRDAHFVCCLVFVRHAADPEPIIATGRWNGRIVDAPRGGGGFGYDPHFLVDGLDRTAAELDLATKNQISHRALALDRLLARAARQRIRRMIPIIPVEATTRALARPGFANTSAGPRLTTLPPLTLYIHFPWCVRKCPYCDFNSHEPRGGIATIPEERYVDALVADLDRVVPQVWGRRVHAIFIGGGTPSLIAPRAIDRLLSEVRARLVLEADAEITMEANPGTVETGRFADYRALGINRLSLGVQSFDDRFLNVLGRIHDGVEARRAVEIACTAFDNVNLDLMYALPGQTPGDAAQDMATARTFDTNHLSLYQLTVEPNTFFAKYPPRLPDDDATDAIEAMLAAEVARGGWQRYEVSAYAKPGRESRHNLNYWNFGDYIGIGAGAHAKLSFPDRIVRQTRLRNPDGYLDRAPSGPAFDEVDVAAAELPFEFMLNALRLVDGVPATRFQERTGVSLTRIADRLARGEALGLLAPDVRRIRPTAKGLRFLNDLQCLFLPDA